MSKRIYNFSAGPATMPLPVLEQASQELVCYGDSGMSVMEMSHRSPAFEGIIQQAEADLRKLMAIPDNYKVLFLQGGATMQFSMVPLNLYRNSMSADFVNTGAWTKKAIADAKKVGKVNVVASSDDTNFNRIPKLDESKFDKNADFFYIVTNNTIFGTRYTELPNVPAGVPLVGDASSNILSEEIDINKFGLLFFGAQKNVGPAGLTVVIVRDDLIGHAGENVPTYLDYAVHAKANSLYNTPPCYSIYMSGLVFKWMLDNGGVPAMQKINEQKAQMLYDFIDNSTLFEGTAAKEDRSIMNVTYVLPNDELTAKFIKESVGAGFSNLKGHRSVGGIRASIYNAMPVEGVQALIDFMKKFELDNK